MCPIFVKRNGISIHALREEGDTSGTSDGTTHGISIHALREEGDDRRQDLPGKGESISIHALREEGDRVPPEWRVPATHFYPRPPRGGRHHQPCLWYTERAFLSTPSARRATYSLWALSRAQPHFYPRPPRGGRPISSLYSPLGNIISIHALREEGDPQGPRSSGTAYHFYPRPPRGGRLIPAGGFSAPSTFLSTPSARRATGTGRTLHHQTDHFYPRPPRGGRRAVASSTLPPTNFYPRPPRGGRPLTAIAVTGAGYISIHALREEGDPSSPPSRHTSRISIHALREEGDQAPQAHPEDHLHFYPRPPRGGRQRRIEKWLRSDPISIHALREEGDDAPRPRRGAIDAFLSTPSARRATHRWPHRDVRRDFYPRPPRGGRQPPLRRVALQRVFLSTPSARRATVKANNALIEEAISIHALREEGDGGSDFPVLVHLIFLSTPSARRATLCGLLCPLSLFISIHALREEGDVVQLLVHQFRLISIHALREEGDSCGAMQAG